MSGDIKVNFAALEQSAANLTQQANTIQGLLSDERGILDTLGGAWTGEAKEAWHANQQRWQAKADELNATLQRLAATLSEVSEDFQRNEKVNQEQWG